MATYAAFLRAINLGPTRQFPKGEIKAATEAAGFTDVETYINTGNVRLTTSMRSRAKIESALEASYAANRGFPVPAISFRVDELREIVDDAALIDAEIGDLGERRHYVSLLKFEPESAAVTTIEAASTEIDIARVRGRAVHLILGTAYNNTPLGNAQVEKAMGVATNRNVTVLRALADRWGS